MSIFEDTDELHLELFNFMSKSRMHIMEVRKQVEKLIKSANLTSSEFALIRFISNNPNLLVNELADLIGITSSTLVIRINSLEEKNYVSRERNLKDRRKVKVNLTQKGMNLLESAKFKPFEFVSKRLDLLTNEEREQLIKILRKLNQNYPAIDEKERKQLLKNHLQKMLGF